MTLKQGGMMNRNQNPRLRGALWCVTAGFAATVAGEAMAQATLQEIVVTARKREESIQDIPVAVTAFTSDELNKRGIAELDDVAMYTPGLVFEDFSSSFSAAPVLRGLTQVNVSSEVQNVATFVDGIYIQRNYAVDIGLADVQRIEVVKGPQSALYGQNAFAGAINYVLNKPREQLDGLAEVTAGSDGRLDYKFAVGGPVIEGKLGLRGYYGHSEFDGTWRNDYPGLSGDAARTGNSDNETYSLMAVATPTDWLSIDATYMRVNREVGNRPGWSENSGDAQNTGNCGPRVGTSTRLTFICGEIALTPAPYQTAASTRPAGAVVLNIPTPGFRNETDFYHAEIGVKFNDALSLVYQYGKVDSGGQEISSPAVNAVAPSFGVNLNALAVGQFQLGFFNSAQKEGSTNDFKSHELRLEYAPQGSPLKATIGAYRSDFDDIYRFFLTSVPVGQGIADTTSGFLDMTGFGFGLLDKQNKGRTTAYFGALSYTFADRLTLGAELRYSEEKKSVLDIRARVTLRDEFSDTIPRFTVDYKLFDNTLLYASAAKGVKTGGFNGVQAGQVTIPVDEQAFGPESNWTYEIGAKNTLLDGRMVLNVAAFSVDWTNMQIQALPSNTPPALVTNTPVIYRNIGNARSRGIEIESQFAATDHLSFNLGASFTDPKYKDGTKSFRFNGRCDGVVCPVDTSVGGNILPRTAKTQIVAGAEWASTFGNEFNYFIRGDVTYQSEMQMEEMNIGQIQPRTLVNARAGIAKGSWSAELWGRNIFDEKYIANSFFIISGVSYGTALGELATYGATARWKF
jgi:iron complex outermembrane receptor protein